MAMGQTEMQEPATKADVAGLEARMSSLEEAVRKLLRALEVERVIGEYADRPLNEAEQEEAFTRLAAASRR